MYSHNINMCFRLSYCCKNTFKQDTACCNLLKVIGYIILGLTCLVVLYFLLVGIGSLTIFTIGSLACNTNSTNSFCKFEYNNFPNNIFGMGFLVGLEIIIGIVIVCMVIGLIGWGIYSIFRLPCQEIVTNWKKAANPEYDTLDIEKQNYNTVNLIVNTSGETTNLPS